MPESRRMRLLPVDEAAERLSISTRSLRNLIALGKLRVVRVTPRRIAIGEDDLNAYIEAHRAGTGG